MSMVFLQIAAGFSWVLAATNVVVCTVYLDEFVRSSYLYDKEDSLFFVILVAVWSSLFKLGVNTVIFRRLESGWKLWCRLHVLFFIFSAITFIVAMVAKANLTGGSTGAAFVGFQAIDFIFSFIATLTVYVLGRQDTFSDVLM